MSQEVIDEKVVSLKFDNKQFEKGTSESLSSIQKLKEAFNFKEATKGLNELKKASNNFELSGISRSVDAIANKFSVMEVAALTAVNNITNSIVNAAKRWVSAVTIDPIKGGVGTYEQKINSVQTILTNSGKSLKEVNGILDSLNDYSDKTIFSLSDMTTALGKFTAAGIDATKAVTIIKGAANEAATMGAGSAEFSRFIYNLSQAYSVGKMTTIDWRSLENAGVAGKKFKEQLIESAKALGTLNKEGKTAKGQLVTAENLREYLKEGIITAEVMTDTFEKYADETTEFGKAANSAATEIKTFSQLMDVLSESVRSTWAQSFGFIIGDFYEAKQLWTNVSTIFEETVGKMNTNRNKMLKAWHDGIIDPALLSKYTTEELRESFDKGLGDPRRISGRTLLMEGFYNILQSILQVVKPVKEAFRELFPATTAKSLWEITKNFRDFTAGLKLSDGAIKEIKDAAKGFFMIFRTIKDVMKDVIGALFPVTKGANSLAVIVIKLAGALGRLITNSLSGLRSSEKYQKILSNITKYASIAVNVVGSLINYIFRLVKGVKESGIVSTIFEKIANGIKNVINVADKAISIGIALFNGLRSAVGLLFISLSQVADNFQNFFGKIFNKKGADKAEEDVTKVSNLDRRSRQHAGTWTREDEKEWQEAREKEKTLKEKEKNNKTLFKNIFDAITGIIGNAVSIIATIVPIAMTIFGKITTFAVKVIEIISSVADVIASIISVIAGIFQDMDVIKMMILGIFTTIIVISNGVIGIIGGLIKNVTNITGSFKSITDGFENATKAFKNMNNPLVNAIKWIAATIMAIATGMYLLSKSFTMISDTLNNNSIGNIIGSLGILLVLAGMMVGIGVAFSKMKISKTATKLIISFSIFMLILSSAFKTITKVIEESNPESIVAALGILIGMAGMLTLVGLVFSKIKVKNSSFMSIIAFSLFIRTLSKVFASVLEIIKETSPSQILGALGILISMAGLLMLVGLVFSKIKIKNESFKTILSFSLFVSVLSIIFKSFSKVLAENDLGVILGSLGILIGIVGMLMLVGLVFSKIKIKNESFKTILSLSVFILVLSSVFTSIVKLISGSNAGIILGSLGVLITIAGLLMLVGLAFSKLKINKQSFKTILAFSLFMGIIGMIFSSIMKSINGASADAVIEGLFILITMAGLLTLVGLVFSHIKVKEQNIRTIIALSVFMGVLGAVFYAIMSIINSSSTDSIIAGLTTLITMAGMLMLVGLVFSKIKIKSESIRTVLALSIFIGVLGAVFSAILAIINNSEASAVLGALGVLITMAGLLMLVGLVFSKIKLKSESLKTVIALSIFMASLSTVFGYIVKIVDNHDLPTILASLGILIGIAGILMLLGLVFSKVKIQTQALAPMIVGIIAIVAIAGALAILASQDWDGMLEAAASMSLCLLAVSAVLLIVSKSSGGLGGAVAAASIIIVAGAMVVLAFALKQFAEIEWDQLGKAGAAIGVLSVLVGILGLVGLGAVLGAAGLLLASVGLIAIAKAMQMFAEVPDGRGGGWLAGLAGSLMLVAIAGVLLIAGAPGLLAAAPGLIRIATAMIVFSKSAKKLGSKLSGIAGGLMLMALAGVLLIAGAPGLLASGVGLLLIGSALLVFNGVKIGGSELSNIGTALMSFALAGIVGLIGGPGLILLSLGIMAMAGALNLLASVVEKVLNFDLGKVADESVNMGGYIVNGLANGIKSGFSAIFNTIGGLAKGIVGTFCDLLGIQSPSTVFKEIGEYILAGLGDGLSDTLMNGNLSDTMKGIADNLLGSFTGELGGGFGKIGDIFDKFNKKTTIRKMKEGHYEAGRGWVWDTWEDVEVGIMDGITDIFGLMSGSFNNLLDQNGFQGSKSLDKMLGGDKLSLQLDENKVSANGLGDSLNGLSTDMDSVTDSNNKMTDSMGKSADKFKEFDRSVVTTSREIQKNILNYIVSEDEWEKMSKEVVALGFDPKMVLEQGINAGKETGYAWLKGILGAFHGKKLNNIDLVGEDFKTWLNDQFALANQSEGNMNNWTKTLEAIAEGTKDVADAQLEVTKQNYHTDGSLYNAYEGYDPSTVQGMTEDENDHTKAVIAAAEAYKNYYDRQAEVAKNSDSALNSDAQNIADLAVSEMTDAIKSAINYYMPAEGFVQLGVNICRGLAAGIYAGRYLSTKAISMSASAIIEEFEKATKIASPSKVFYQLGDYLMQGLANGISDTNDPQSSTKDLAKNLTDTFQALMTDILGVMESDEEFTPTIRPVVDFSSIQASASEAQRLFDGTNVSLAGTEFSNYKASLQTPQSNVMSMSKDEFQSFLNNFANTIVEGINSGDKNVTVDVNLEGDAKGMFKVIRDQNTAYKRATGYSAFV